MNECFDISKKAAKRDNCEELYKKYRAQRAVRGFDDAAGYNMNSYISDLICDMTEFMRQHTYTTPLDMDWSEWTSVLSQLHEYFSIVSEAMDNPSQVDSGEAEAAKDLGFELLKKYFWDLWI